MVSLSDAIYLFAGILTIGLVVYFVGFGLFRIKSGQVGILVRKFSGKPMPQGQVIALKGQIGVQADTIPPNLYWRNPLFWSVIRDGLTIIPDGKIGLVEAIDGRVLPPSRRFGDEISCNSYQDAEAFLKGGGYKGKQIGILRNGNYRINTKLFKVTVEDIVGILAGRTGIVTAEDGISIPPKLIIAPTPTSTDTNTIPDNRFLDAQEFINDGGFRGIQLQTLQAGEYNMNTDLFTIEVIPQTKIPPGYVGVLLSKVGEELERSVATPTMTAPDANQEIITHDIEHTLIKNPLTRGILQAPLAPGDYNLNTYAYTMYPVPVSAITVDWASSDRPVAPTAIPASDTRGLPMDTTKSILGLNFFRFNELNVISKDGFPLEVDVRIVVRILPENAAFVIARFGTIDNLIQQIIHPLIDATFRNNAGSRGALDFFQARTELQDEAFTKAQEVFKDYHVEVQTLLISFVLIPKELLNTQTLKQIAVQEKAQFDAQAAAQTQRIDVENKTAIANKQIEVVNAQLQVPINQNKAMALVKEAEGIQQSTMIKADGTAYALRKEGEGLADAYGAQASVIGPDKVAGIKMFEEIGINHTQITPNVYVQGTSGKDGDGMGNNALLTTYLATLLASTNTDKPAYVPKTAELFKSSLSQQGNDLIEAQKKTMQSQVASVPTDPLSVYTG